MGISPPSSLLSSPRWSLTMPRRVGSASRTIVKSSITSSPAGGGPIFAVGDSFICVDGVSDHETWPAIPETLPGHRVLRTVSAPQMSRRIPRDKGPQCLLGDSYLSRTALMNHRLKRMVEDYSSVLSCLSSAGGGRRMRPCRCAAGPPVYGSPRVHCCGPPAPPCGGGDT